MSCDLVREQLADYSAGFLEDADRGRVEAHLGACDMCRAHLAELRALDRLMAGDRTTAPQSLVLRVMDGVGPASVRPRHAWVYLLDDLGPALAAMVLLPAILLLALREAAAWTSTTHPLDLAALFAQPTTAVAATLGMALVAGVALWFSQQVAGSLARI
jgi:anti-sigma factor RsiW